MALIEPLKIYKLIILIFKSNYIVIINNILNNLKEIRNRKQNNIY